MRVMMLVGMVLALSGCAKREAERAAAHSMKDPASAEFRSVTTNANGVCGEINSKNSYGAYAGFQRFAFDRGSKQVVFDPDVSITDEEWGRAIRECQADTTIRRIDPTNTNYDPDVSCANAANLARQRNLRIRWAITLKRLC